MGLQETGMIGDPLPWPLPQGEGNSFGIARDWNDEGKRIATAVFGSAMLDTSQSFIPVTKPFQGDQENNGKEDQHGGDG